MTATPAEGPATNCDGCRTAIAYGQPAYVIKTGDYADGLPVARILCDTCFWSTQ